MPERDHSLEAQRASLTMFGARPLAVSCGEGEMVHLKSQAPLDPAGRLVGRGDMRAQVRQVLANIAMNLSDLGGTMDDVVSLTHFTTDMDAFMDACDVRREILAGSRPVTTTAEVARLSRRDVLVETTVLAKIPFERFHRPGA